MRSLARHFTIASALSLFSSVPARADLPALGPQFNVTPPDYSSYFAGDSAPAVATNGTDFLVAWEGRTPTYVDVVFCARFSAAGVLLDQDAIALGLPAGPPSVFWDGTKYLVVSETTGQRVDPATGTPDAPLATWVFDDSSVEYMNAWGGGVLLQAASVNGKLDDYAILVDVTGKIVAFSALPSDAADSVAVGYSNGTFLLAWNSGGTVEGLRITTAGTVEDTTPIVIDAGHTSSAATPDGGTSTALAGTSSLQITGSPSGFLATWTDQRGGADDVYAARVGTDGTVTDPGGVLVAANTIDGQPGATWTGTDWWIGWNVSAPSSYSMVGATFETNGTIGPTKPIGSVSNYPSTYPPGSGPALAATPQALFATWANGQGAILGKRFDTTRAPLDGTGVAVSSHLAQQTGVRLATSSAGYMVSWYEPFPNAVGDIEYAASAVRLGVDGTPIDTTPVPVFENFTGAGVYGALGGGAFAAAYANQTGHTIQIVTLAGPGASSFTNVATEQTNTGGFAFAPLAMTCMTDRCVVVWYDNNAANTYPAYAAVMMADGTLTPTVAVGSADMAVAGTDGSSFLVITDYGSIFPIAADGTAGAALPLQPVGPLAWGIDRYMLLSWGSTSNTIERLTSGGALIGAQEQAPSFAQTYLQAGVGWDGRAFLVYQGATAAEVPASAPSANLTSFPLFGAGTSTTKVASAAPNTAIALGSALEGGMASPRAVARMLSTPDEPDGGTPPVDSGAPPVDGGDSGLPGSSGQDAGDDGGSPDAGHDDDAGRDDDAGNDAGTSKDAGSGDAGTSKDAGSDDAGTSPNDDDSGTSVGVPFPDAGSPDATVVDDGGSLPATATPGASGGCGCTTAGAAPSSSPLGGLFALGAVIALARRRSPGRARRGGGISPERRSSR